MITINQLAYQMKTDEKVVLDKINECNKYQKNIKIKDGTIRNSLGVIIGLMIFLNCSYSYAHRIKQDYKRWKKRYKKTA